MQPLLKIETVPMSIEYVEKPSKVSSMETAMMQASLDSSKTPEIKRPKAPASIDRFELSAGPKNAVASYVPMAKSASSTMMNLDGSTKSGTVSEHAYQQVGRGIEQMIDILPKAPVVPIAAIKPIEVTVAPSEPIKLDLSLPDLEMKVVQMSKVIIEYTGGPIYVPRSSDPAYVDPKDNNQIFDGKPAFEAKA